MNMKLKNKVAIVTGSSRGIGFSIAKAFVKEGASVVICGSRQSSADKAKEKILSEYPLDHLAVGDYDDE